MNAVISAGQFNMHKKDCNDRMSSLAFKMEKVFNLDKRKKESATEGERASGEVYKFFINTFGKDFD